MNDAIAAIVLAAGQGTRMRSKLPKVLHLLFGEPMLVHVVRAAALAGAREVVVVINPAHRADVAAALAQHELAARVHLAEQATPRGTGDAARVGLEAVPADLEQVLVVCGDTPMLTPATLRALGAARGSADVAVLACELSDPSGYGRVRTDAAGRVLGIVEHKDASEAERQIRLVNSGVYAAKAAFLRTATAALTANNAQGELYLTDVVAAAAAHGQATALRLAEADEARGVNSRLDLSEVTAAWQRRIVRAHAAAGVTFVQPSTTVCGPRVTLGQDVVIGPGVQLLGTTRIAAGATVDGPSWLWDTSVAERAHIKAFCHLEAASVGVAAQVGPYARLRPGAQLAAESRVGNFVEIKQATLGERAKVNHLAYVGDAEVGAEVNIGAGTIVCNYDGVQKHRTRIGTGAFVGSNATLVAPLTLGEHSLVAAGSTVTDDVPSEALAFGRARQSTLPGRAQALREKLARAKKATST